MEQIPNPGFRCDCDANGRPDGLLGCTYAPAGVAPPGAGRATEFTDATTTAIHGPETGRTSFSFAVRTADGRPHKLTPILTLTEIDRTDELIRAFALHNIDAHIAIGGDGSMGIATALARKGLRIVGVPKTIDNDLDKTVVTFGFDTAVAFATEALDRLQPVLAQVV